MSKRIVQQIVDVPVPQIPKQIVEVILDGCGSRQHGWTCPQLPEHNVDVIKVILQEQCQRMRFFSFESVWEGSCGQHGKSVPPTAAGF